MAHFLSSGPRFRALPASGLRPAALLLGVLGAACGSVEPGDEAGPSGGPAEAVLVGPGEEARIGYAFSAAGDFDGDGHPDLVVGAPGDGFTHPGSAFVALGPFAEQERTLGGEKSIELVGEDLDHAVGVTVAGLGDIDGDGLADVAVAAAPVCEVPPGCSHDCPVKCSGGPSRSYIVHGRAGSEPIALADVAAGKGGMLLEAESEDDLERHTIAPLGDLNGDGLADFAVGALSFDGYKGRVFVVFGRPGSEPIRLSDLEEGKGGWVIEPPADTLTPLGNDVVDAGDVNGDGLSDLLVSMPDFSPDAPGGRAWVVFGKTSGSRARLDDPELEGFVMRGESGQAGISLGSAGDVNGDGLADVLVSAPFFGNYEDTLHVGRAYVVFGKKNRAPVELGDVAAGEGGYAFTGERLSKLGLLVAARPLELDADGVPDVLIRNGNDREQVLHGRADAGGEPRVSPLPAPSAPGPWYLRAASSVGDLDGNGEDDLVFGGSEAKGGKLLVVHR